MAESLLVILRRVFTPESLKKTTKNTLPLTCNSVLFRNPLFPESQFKVLEW